MSISDSPSPLQPPAPGSKPELMTKRSSEGRKDTASALADAIRKVSSSGSGLDDALKAEKEGEAEGREKDSTRATSFTQPSSRPQGHHRQVCFAMRLKLGNEIKRTKVLQALVKQEI